MAVKQTRNQIIRLVRDAGVAGAGGGGFPTHVKLDAKVQTIIANGAECEPLVRVDQQEAAMHPAELLQGIETAMKATGAVEAVIALKRKYYDAIENLSETIQRRRKQKLIRIHLLDDFYPAGDEFVLVREVTGKSIGEFGLPLHTGTVVANISTLLDVNAAVQKGKPVTHRSVTVGGAVAGPRTIKVPIGTPVSALIEAAGGSAAEDPRILIGGPMMGSLADDPESPVTKTTGMVLVLPESHPVIQRRMRSTGRQMHLARAACLKCMMCTEVCPRNLLGHRLYPDRLMRNIAAGVTEDLDAFTGSYLCSECGLCAVYGCVMNLDPAWVNRSMKEHLSSRGVKRPEAADTVPRIDQEIRKVPTKRLIARLGLSRYEHPAPFMENTIRPGKLIIPLRQHAGAAAIPVVRAGDRVKADDLLGEIPENALGARIHTGVSGKIISVNEKAVIMEAE